MKIEDLYYPIPETDIDDENFDIKKWRIENPMDYLKAMYIIINTPDKNVVFKKYMKFRDFTYQMFYINFIR